MFFIMIIPMIYASRVSNDSTKHIFMKLSLFLLEYFSLKNNKIGDAIGIRYNRATCPIDCINSHNKDIINNIITNTKSIIQSITVSKNNHIPYKINVEKLFTFSVMNSNTVDDILKLYPNAELKVTVHTILSNTPVKPSTTEVIPINVIISAIKSNVGTPFLNGIVNIPIRLDGNSLKKFLILVHGEYFFFIILFNNSLVTGFSSFVVVLLVSLCILFLDICLLRKSLALLAFFIISSSTSSQSR